MNVIGKKNVITRLLSASVAIAMCLFLAACGDDSSNNASSDNSIVPLLGTMVDARDGKTYKTVKIGRQTWMAENLNYDIVGSRCFNDDAVNCFKYGRLYTWDAAISVCPSGYRLPDESEWEVLFQEVGGISEAGKMLRSKSGWADGNGKDSYGFSVLPSGWTDADASDWHAAIVSYASNLVSHTSNPIQHSFMDALNIGREFGGKSADEGIGTAFWVNNFGSTSDNQRGIKFYEHDVSVVNFFSKQWLYVRCVQKCLGRDYSLCW